MNFISTVWGGDKSGWHLWEVYSATTLEGEGDRSSMNFWSGESHTFEGADAD